MLEMVQELQISGRRIFKIEHKASARALRQECVWNVEGAWYDWSGERKGHSCRG